ncbi:MAG: TIGR00366 family protein [Thermoanaerobaculum sp.]|nr:TIGR00366 family protein [Thermoanaerobaculum sp.]
MAKAPNVFVIVFSLSLLVAAASWVVPGGQYQRTTVTLDGGQREVVDPASFRFVAAQPQWWQVFAAPIRGFGKLWQIIVFIFLVGGAFAVVNETQAIAAGVGRLVELLRHREYLVIPVVMTLFALFGAAFGMCEEAIPFVLIFVPLSLALGYDSIVGLCLSFLAAGVGFAAAFVNPFTLQIAQSIAGLPLLSGMGFRLVVFFLATSLTIAWVMVYAARIRKDPTKSLTYDLDLAKKEEWRNKIAQQPSLTARQTAVLVVLLATIVLTVWGAIAKGWFIVELGALFFAMGLAAGFLAGFSANRLAQIFVQGAKDIAGAALVVGFAGGILVLLEDSRILDTLLYAGAQLTRSLSPVVAAWAMYGVQFLLNIAIPSGSTKAALTMPLMAPLADLSGITRQVAVLAYQFGDGFTNMIIPTSGVTVATLELAGVPFVRWFRWLWPLQVVFVVFSLVFLAIAVAIGWS